jgi:hypothetical protein
MRAWLRGG